jgi:flavin-dependent dehydrogenase
MVGSRWNLDLNEQLEFDETWERTLRSRIATGGARASPVWLDYFVFSRTSPLVELPPFAVGRPRWDNWMIFRARSLGIPVTDATACVDVVHQNHGYPHVPEATGDRWHGPEAEANHALARETPMLSTLHSTHVMTSRGPRPALGRPTSRRAGGPAIWSTGSSSASRGRQRASTECAREVRSRASGAARFHPQSEP